MVSRASNTLEVEKSADTDDTNSTDFLSLLTPTSCPACGSAASFDDTNATSRSKSSVGQVLRCQGPSLLCPPRAIGALQHAFSRDALDVKRISEKRIEQLMNAGFLRTPSDIFSIANDEAKLEELADLDGWGERSVHILASEAKRVATEGVTLSRFIYSLGIRLAGVHSSSLIAAAYGNVNAFLEDLERSAKLDAESTDNTQAPPFACLQEESEATKGIGPVLLASLSDFASQKEMVAAARQLAQSIRVLDDTNMAVSTADATSDGELSSSTITPLSGLSVVFTGSVPGLTRTAAKKLAKEMGAKSTPGSVSKSTGLVVSGVKGGKKHKQAEELGVRVIDADEFLKMVDKFRSG